MIQINILVALLPVIVIISILQFISAKKEWRLRNGTDRENIKANTIKNNYNLISFLVGLIYVWGLILIDHLSLFRIQINPI